MQPLNDLLQKVLVKGGNFSPFLGLTQEPSHLVFFVRPLFFMTRRDIWMRSFLEGAYHETPVMWNLQSMQLLFIKDQLTICHCSLWSLIKGTQISHRLG